MAPSAKSTSTTLMPFSCITLIASTEPQTYIRVSDAG